MAERRTPGSWIPYAVVAGTLMVTILIVAWLDYSADAKDRLRFDREVARAELSIISTFNTYATLTRAVVAFHAGDEVTTPDEFRRFAGRMRIRETYPGVLGLGFSRRLKPELVQPFEAFMRSQGVPDYTVHPKSTRAEFHAIQFLEPQDRRNRVALGYDMFSDPIRRRAMEKARDAGGAAISGKVLLVQEIDTQKQSGFLIYSPAYQGGGVPSTLEQRRAKLIGFGYAPFRAGDLFASILSSEMLRSVHFRIYAGPAIDSNLLYVSSGAPAEPRFRTARTMRIVGSPWTVVASTNPTFDRTSERRWIPWVILNGVVLALVLFLLTRSVVRNRNAVELALADLRDREERFQQVARATNDAIWDWDLGTNEIWWNEGVETLFGYRRDDIPPAATWWYERIHPDDRDRVAAEINAIIEGDGGVWRGEYRFIRKDGTYAQVLDRGSLVRNAKGTATRMIGAMFDVSPLVIAEQKLAASERRFRTLVTTTSTIVWRVDPEGRVVVPMISWEHFTGQEFEQYQDRGWLESVHPDDREMAVKAWRDSIPGKRPFRVSYRILHHGGEYRSVEVSGAPILDDHGEIIEWTGTARDVTEERAAEAAVREAAERFRFLAESVPQKIFTATPDGRNEYLNRQWTEYTGMNPEHARLGQWTEMIHLDDLAETIRRWRASMETGQPFEVEHRIRRADGQWHWHLTRAHAMRDESNRIVLWVGTSTDIEEQKQTERTLDRLYREADAANRAKDEFLATVSHELRTPMTAILGWSHLLSLGDLDDETRGEAVDTIHRSGKAQAQLIDDMLDVSRIATGKLHLTMESVMVAPIVRNAIRAIAPAAEAKGVTLTSEVDEPGPRVRADATRLQQIFWNLLSNAVKFTPPGGEVRVRLYPEGGEVVFEVTDTGKGITPDFLPFVFDRFRQEETSSTRHYSGLGLGLSIVKQLTEMHGGRAEAGSEGEGKGATFRVFLPVRALDLDATGRFQRQRKGEGRSVEGLRVLLVDDDADARRVVAAILEQSGASVTVAGSAAEALERWNDYIDVLLTDIAMPRRDGYDLLASLKGAHGRALVPAIALTAYGRPEDAERILAAGFRRHLVKPVEPQELIDAIAEVAKS